MDNKKQTVNVNIENAKKMAARRIKPAKNRQADAALKESVFASGGLGDFHTIERPSARRRLPFKRADFKIDRSWLKRGSIAIAVLTLVLVVRAVWSENQTGDNPAVAEKWHALKLVDGEVFYGRVADPAADPVVVRNVYYDYDQMKDKKEEARNGETNPAGNIRLVKRGRETHGPDGTLNVVRSQILYLEPLSEESKVLKAIIDNEK